MAAGGRVAEEERRIDGEAGEGVRVMEYCGREDVGWERGCWRGGGRDEGPDGRLVAWRRSMRNESKVERSAVCWVAEVVVRESMVVCYRRACSSTLERTSARMVAIAPVVS